LSGTASGTSRPRADGAPHVIPVCYALDASALYFVADEKPKRGPARRLQRLVNLRENPRAALVVDDYDEDWTRLAWLLVRGPASVVSAPAMHARASRCCAALPAVRRHGTRRPAANPVVRIDPSGSRCGGRPADAEEPPSDYAMRRAYISLRGCLACGLARLEAENREIPSPRGRHVMCGTRTAARFRSPTARIRQTLGKVEESRRPSVYV
jgi:PPOX class probable F420-dependent enzyme